MYSVYQNTIHKPIYSDLTLMYSTHVMPLNMLLSYENLPFALPHPLIYPNNPDLTHLLPHLFTHLFTHLLTHLFIHPLPHLSTLPLPRRIPPIPQDGETLPPLATTPPPPKGKGSDRRKLSSDLARKWQKVRGTDTPSSLAPFLSPSLLPRELLPMNRVTILVLWFWIIALVSTSYPHLIFPLFLYPLIFLSFFLVISLFSLLFFCTVYGLGSRFDERADGEQENERCQSNPYHLTSPCQCNLLTLTATPTLPPQPINLLTHTTTLSLPPQVSNQGGRTRTARCGQESRRY